MAKSKKSDRKNNQKNQTGEVQVSSDGVYSFGSEHTFTQFGMPVQPGRLQTLAIVKITGHNGQFKVIGKRMDGKKLIIECEKLGGALQQKVQWMKGEVPFGHDKDGNPISLRATKETYVLEAICQGTNGRPDEYGITHRQNLIWVRQIDCVPA